MSEAKHPTTNAKFRAGQVAVLNHSKKLLPFVILDVIWDEVGGWCYGWGRKNYASERMIRALTVEEISGPSSTGEQL